MYFYSSTLAFVLGVALSSFIALDYFFVYCVALLFAVASYLVRRRFIYGITCGVIFLFLGMLRFEGAQEARIHNERLWSAKKTRTVEGIVMSEPRFYRQSVGYTLGFVREVKEGVFVGELPGKLEIFARVYPRVAYGDVLEAECTIEPPSVYAAKSGTVALCRYPLVRRIPAGSSRVPVLVSVTRVILSFKNGVLARQNALVPRPHSALLSGLLMGDTSGLPETIEEQFHKTGTSHIVALSGYNIAIIIGLFATVAPYLWLSRKSAWIVIVPFLIVFVIATGGASSVIRAAVMGIIAGLAMNAGRLSDVRRVLPLAALLMLAVNPYLLRFDIGFQLSFFATLGIVYLTPRVSRALTRGASFLGETAKQKEKRKSSSFAFLESFERMGHAVIVPIREALSTTLGATVAVTPILLLQFGRISLISPLVNVLILPAVPFAMAFGFAGVLLSYIYFPLGQVVAWGAWVLLEYILRTVEFFG